MNFTAEKARALLESQRGIIETIAVKETAVGGYAALIPTSTGGNPFAETVTYTSATEAGLADWINGNADDVPNADVGQVAAIARIHTAAIGYGYGFAELGQNSTLTADKAKAARRAYERFVNNVAMNGDTRKGLSGLLTQSGAENVTRGASNTKTWTSATAAELLDIIYGILSDVEQDGQRVADTLLLPANVYKTLASTTSTNGTALQQLLEGNPFTAETGGKLTVRGLKALDDGAANGSDGRIVAYANNEDTLRLHIPMTHRFMQTYQAGPLRWEVPGLFRMGGVNVLDPSVFHYFDNQAS